MSLRIRKILYASLTLIACVVWLPLAFAGIALLVGAVGLLAIGALLRAITALPITDQFKRWYFSVAIGIGIVLMTWFVVFSVSDPEAHALLLPVLSGILLVGVGIAVLTEIHTKRT